MSSYNSFFQRLVFFIFSKPVIDSIDEIKVADLFRNSSTHLNLNYSRRSILQISTFVIIFIFFFCILNVKPQQTAVFFLFFTIISFFYFFLSKLYIVILNRIKNVQNISFKMVIKNLKAYSSLNSIIIMTMGLGIRIVFSGKFIFKYQ